MRLLRCIRGRLSCLPLKRVTIGGQFSKGGGCGGGGRGFGGQESGAGGRTRIRRSVGVIFNSVSFVWSKRGERYCNHGNLII